MENFRSQVTARWLTMLAVGLTLSLITVAVPHDGIPGRVLYLGTAVASLGFMLRAALAMPVGVRSVWWALLVYQTLALLGIGLLDGQQGLSTARQSLTSGDLALAASYGAVLVALVILVRRIHPGRNRESWIDTLILAAATTAVIGAFIVAPAVIDSPLSGMNLFVATAMPMLDVIVLCALVWLIMSSGRTNPALVLIAAAFGLYLVGDVLRDLSLASGFTEEAWGVYRGLYLGALVLMAAAANGPGARSITATDDSQDTRVSPARVAVLAFGLMTIPVIRILRVAGSGDTVTIALAVIGLVIIVLMLWRVILLVRLIEGQRRLTSLVLDSTVDGIVGMDLDGTVLFANLSARRMLRTREADLLGVRFHDVAHHHYPDGREYPWEECPTRATLHSGAGGAIDGQYYIRRDGSTFPVEIFVSPLVVDGTYRGSVASFRDISERQAIAEVQRQFVSIVSHELRTPLTSIKGSLQMLDSGLFGELSPDQQELVTMAVNNSERLARLVDDILDLERLDSGRMPLIPQQVDMAILADECAATVRGVAAIAAITVEAIPPPEGVDLDVYVDPHRMGQVLVNLLGNAVKFSEAGSRVQTTVERHGDRVIVQVVDHGRGIPEEQLLRVFDRFGQVEMGDAREHGGTGLGLAIAKEIVERSGGTISVTSTLGEGSTFCVDLPAAHVETPVHVRSEA